MRGESDGDFPSLLEEIQELEEAHQEEVRKRGYH